MRKNRQTHEQTDVKIQRSRLLSAWVKIGHVVRKFIVILGNLSRSRLQKNVVFLRMRRSKMKYTL